MPLGLSRIAARELAGATEARVNSSHHQSIKSPARELRIVARAPDGVVEAVEWTGDSNWVMGVQWHPERMAATDRSGAGRCFAAWCSGAGRPRRSASSRERSWR